MKVNYHILNNSVVVNYDGETHTINVGDGRYHDVIACIKENRLEDIPDALDVGKSFERMGLTLVDGVIHMDGQPLPRGLSNKVMAIREMGLPTEPLFKFWENLRKNPSFNSREMLYQFLEHNQHPITEDGCFIAYRGVTDDFKDRHTGTFDNSVGAVCQMPREQVDDNPNNTCSSGLHVASFNYAYGFGPKRVEVKVNPADVVCVPRDYDGTKMRVCKFEVVAEATVERDEPIYNMWPEEPEDDYELDWDEYGMDWDDDYNGEWADDSDDGYF